MALDWLKDLGGKPDHPMYNAEQAAALLADVPRDKPEKALGEIAAWLESVARTPGFRVDQRAAVVQLLDETGQPFQFALLRRYLAAPESREFCATHVWQAVHGFWAHLAHAYLLCVNEFEQGAKGASGLKDQLPQLFIRATRAAANHMKVTLMRYLALEQEDWSGLYRLYSVAASRQALDAQVIVKGDTQKSSMRLEFVKALMLDLGSPETLPPEQIELAWRVVGRFAGSFELASRPGPGSTFCLNLAQPHAPQRARDGTQPGPGLLFFGAGSALSRLQQAIQQHEAGNREEENRFGDEYTRGETLTVLKHLALFWGPDPPRRRHQRLNLSAVMDVVHGYSAVCNSLTRVDYSGMAELSEEMEVNFGRQQGLGLAAEEMQITPEAWDQQNISAGGVFTRIPAARGAWARVGHLCGIKAQDGDAWMAGVIRRLSTDAKGQVHAGIEVLAKDPVCVWLRVIGKGEDRVSNWETASGSFAYDYVESIVVTDDRRSLKGADMLVPKETFVAGKILEVMMGEKPPHIRLTELVEQCGDFERVKFKWLSPGG